jgi:hypothetical protein
MMFSSVAVIFFIVDAGKNKKNISRVKIKKNILHYLLFIGDVMGI